MTQRIILASGSNIRKTLLENANVEFDVVTAKIDEASLRESLLVEGATPREIVDALSDSKARKISTKHPEATVIGCDQVLDFDGEIFAKPNSPEDAIFQLIRLSANSHKLLSAVTVYQNATLSWKHIGVVNLEMRTLSETYITDYVERNWEEIRYTAGCYMLEKEGVRLFSTVRGDYFSVLGLPLIELLGYLTRRGVLTG